MGWPVTAGQRKWVGRAPELLGVASRALDGRHPSNPVWLRKSLRKIGSIGTIRRSFRLFRPEFGKPGCQINSERANRLRYSNSRRGQLLILDVVLTMLTIFGGRFVMVKDVTNIASRISFQVRVDGLYCIINNG